MRMQFYKGLFLLCFVAVCAAGPLACAQEVPLDSYNRIIRYDFEWNGIALGKIALEVSETDGAYAVRTLVKSRGVASFFVKHTSDSNVKGERSAAGYVPRTYMADVTTRKKNKKVLLEFDGSGLITKQENIPADTDRPKVKAQEMEGARDPLSTVLAIRKAVYDSIGSGKTSFDLHMFDGKRLFKLDMTIDNQVTKSIGGEERAVIHVIAARTPVAGFTEKELERAKEKEPPLNIYFSDDSALIPLAMDVSFFGGVAGTAVKECATIAECF